MDMPGQSIFVPFLTAVTISSTDETAASAMTIYSAVFPLNALIRSFMSFSSFLYMYVLSAAAAAADKVRFDLVFMGMRLSQIPRRMHATAR